MKIQKGDRVLLNREGQKQFPKPPYTGTVLDTRMTEDRGLLLSVKMDGRKNTQSWAAAWFTEASEF